MKKLFGFFHRQSLDRQPDSHWIEGLDGFDLVHEVFIRLSRLPAMKTAPEYETVLSWDPKHQAIYMVWQLEGEVNNGGYNQFYANPAGVFYRYMPEALRRIGAERFAALMDRANEIYETEYNRITRYQDGTLKGFSESYEDNPLNELDELFYDLYSEEDLLELQCSFIRNHKSFFAGLKK